MDTNIEGVVVEQTPAIPEQQEAVKTNEGIVEPTGTDESVSPDTGDLPDDNAATEPSKLIYDGQEVEVDIPDDLRETFKGHGLDADKLVAELYGGEEFGLSDDTKASLYKIYGKTVVDSYLNGLKAQNDSVFGQYKQQQQAHQEANEKLWNETLELVGGEEGWASLEEYALNSLSDDELDEFNQVMASGSRYAQRLALKDLSARREGTEGTEDLKLIDGESRGNSDKGFLTRQEYLELHTTGEYKKNPKHYDALRSVGLSKGL